MTRLLLLALVVLAGNASAAGAEFFVSPAGRDTNPGTADKPFATLERARDAARMRRVAEPQAAVRIVVGGGTYRSGQTIVFDLRDSTDNAATEIVAAPGERPVLSGAAPLPGGWRPAPQDLARLAKPARSKVWVPTCRPTGSRFARSFRATPCCRGLARRASAS